jgi:cell division protease FtsH
VRRIVEGCYARARRTLDANRKRLESLARALLEHETLDEDDAYRAAGFEREAPADAESTAEETDSAELPAG